MQVGLLPQWSAAESQHLFLSNPCLPRLRRACRMRSGCFGGPILPGTPRPLGEVPATDPSHVRRLRLAIPARSRLLLGDGSHFLGEAGSRAHITQYADGRRPRPRPSIHSGGRDPDLDGRPQRHAPPSPGPGGPLRPVRGRAKDRCVRKEASPWGDGDEGPRDPQSQNGARLPRYGRKSSKTPRQPTASRSPSQEP